MWLKIRATAEERSAWQAKAEAGGFSSLSAMVRHAIDGTRSPKRRQRANTDPALLRQLALIGNNLNQLARWVNRDRSKVEALAVIARLIEIDRELAALRASIEQGTGDAD